MMVYAGHVPTHFMPEISRGISTKGGISIAMFVYRSVVFQPLFFKGHVSIWGPQCSQLVSLSTWMTIKTRRIATFAFLLVCVDVW